MRKWKFIGDHYELSLYRWRINPVIGGIYTEEQLRKMWDEETCMPFDWDLNRVDEDWQEVTEEDVKLTEAEKIMLIGFLNENFEEFCDFINYPENISPDYYFSLEGGYRGKPSNLIDKIEKL